MFDTTLQQRFAKLRADFDLLRAAAAAMHAGLGERSQPQDVIRGDLEKLWIGITEMSGDMNKLGAILDQYDEIAGDDVIDDEGNPLVPAVVNADELADNGGDNGDNGDNDEGDDDDEGDDEPAAPARPRRSSSRARKAARKRR